MHQKQSNIQQTPAPNHNSNINWPSQIKTIEQQKHTQPIGKPLQHLDAIPSAPQDEPTKEKLKPMHQNNPTFSRHQPQITTPTTIGRTKSKQWNNKNTHTQHIRKPLQHLDAMPPARQDEPTKEK